MRAKAVLLVSLMSMAAVGSPLWGGTQQLSSWEEKTRGMERRDGFFPFYWDAREGKIWLEIARWEEEFLYVSGLSTGLGSNPVGLDRGQLGRERLVQFIRSGPRVLLLERNVAFRAESEDAEERRAVEESFAQSVLWGAEVAAQEGERVLVDATDFLLRDAHGVARRLQQTRQGNYQLDVSRSALFLPRTRAFPDNTEFEVILTFKGSEPGPLVREVTPSPESVTLRQRHSFIRLPEPGYRPRRFDPRAGLFGISYADYASPLDQPLVKRWISRHRLERSDPGDPGSPPREPIVYYVDPAIPEPIRSAVLEGAGWWAAAFEAAGFPGGYRVELLPPGADPLDVRYNVIQWVHRSTRGWSYGNAVTDPRTGEILKGHVSLGSLRVRQDHLILQGLPPREGGGERGLCDWAGGGEAEYLAALDPDSSPVEVALARIRQLAAHEVGHTLGLAHNFAASTYGRASVMDYPAPWVRVTPEGELDVSQAYGEGVGAWDVFAIRYAYSEFPPGVDEEEALQGLIQEALREGLLFISDADARPAGAAHPLANLWDNGAHPVEGLRQVLQVRRVALDRFGAGNLPQGRPWAELEEVLLPLYLSHRYQVEAAAKMLGGVYYHYAVKGDGQVPWREVPPREQREALELILQTLSVEFLHLPDAILSLIPPRPFGYQDQGELFPSRAAPLLDPLAAAETAARITVQALLQFERAARLQHQHSRNAEAPDLREVVERLLDQTWRAPEPEEPSQAALARVVETVLLEGLIDLAQEERASAQVTAVARACLRELEAFLSGLSPAEDALEQAHRMQALEEIRTVLQRPLPPRAPREKLPLPPGSPIGHRPGGSR